MEKRMTEKTKVKQLRELSNLLDTKFEGPGGFRFGLDGILGLVPFIGDLVTSGLSIYIIAQAAALGVGPATLIRMAINVGIENVFDMIPVIGNFFDFYWKSNAKNIQLLEKHLADPARETIKSRMVIALICFTLIALLIFSCYVTYLALMKLFMVLSALL